MHDNNNTTAKSTNNYQFKINCNYYYKLYKNFICSLQRRHREVLLSWIQAWLIDKRTQFQRRWKKSISSRKKAQKQNQKTNNYKNILPSNLAQEQERPIVIITNTASKSNSIKICFCTFNAIDEEFAVNARRKKFSKGWWQSRFVKSSDIVVCPCELFCFKIHLIFKSIIVDVVWKIAHVMILMRCAIDSVVHTSIDV